ncbi:DUF4345 family protein [Aestuariirhabdus sp. LZHN29]|uniref:DUF4345 family protein n=1 Tax=Aestuariirhabdus sp. LZHN29 TaxID=3417462 RepID=UPI003CEAC9CC
MTILRLIGALYLLSGVWCLLAPKLASGYLGYGALSPAAQAEFFTVYGGLQTGLGVAMLWCSLIQPARAGALLFATLFSAILALSRLISILNANTPNEHTLLLALELSIAAALIYSCYRDPDLSFYSKSGVSGRAAKQ